MFTVIVSGVVFIISTSCIIMVTQQKKRMLYILDIQLSNYYVYDSINNINYVILL